MMTKTLSIRFAGSLLAAFAFSGCIAPDDSEEIDVDFDVEADAQGKGDEPTQEEIDKMDEGVPPEVVVGNCYHGASTELLPIDITAERCELSQVHEIYDFAMSDGQFQLVQFLLALNGNAKIQCHQYYDINGDKRWCADVIDRYADGSPLVKGTEFGHNTRNYFVAYVGDADGSAEKDYWDDMVADPMWTVPPVELSETGFIMKHGGFAPQYDNTSRGTRLLKFDPRDCPHCGLYDGPGITYVANPGLTDIANGWWPPVTSSSCNIWTQQTFGQWAHMGSSTCAAEYNYRATSR